MPTRSWASWRGFHPDEPDEDYQGWEWYLNIQRCPFYCRDLNIVSIAPDGETATFSTMWYDNVTRIYSLTISGFSFLDPKFICGMEATKIKWTILSAR